MNKIEDAVDFEKTFNKKSEIDENFEPVSLGFKRIFEIGGEVLKLFFYEISNNDKFNLFSMLKRKDIKIIKMSNFCEENLKKLEKICLSFRSEGFCFIENTQFKLIAYNDKLNKIEQEMILLHEYAHIHLKHTQQCQLAELEATCFASIFYLLMTFENDSKNFGKNKFLEIMNMFQFKDIQKTTYSA